MDAACCTADSASRSVLYRYGHTYRQIDRQIDMQIDEQIKAEK